MLEFYRRLPLASRIFFITGVIYLIYTIWTILFHDEVLFKPNSITEREIFKSGLLVYMSIAMLFYAWMYNRLIVRSALWHAILTLPAKAIIIIADIIDYITNNAPAYPYIEQHKSITYILLSTMVVFIFIQYLGLFNIVRFIIMLIRKRHA